MQYQHTFGAYLPKHTIWITLHMVTKLNSSQICISHKQFMQQMLKQWKPSIHRNTETVVSETVVSETSMTTYGELLSQSIKHCIPCKYSV